LRNRAAAVAACLCPRRTLGTEQSACSATRRRCGAPSRRGCGHRPLSPL